MRVRYSDKIKNYIIARIFFLVAIILIIVYCILICNEQKELEHMAVKYSAENKDTDSKLTNIMKNIYIKKGDNVKIYNVATKKDRDLLKKQNNNVYKRYLNHLISLELTPSDVTSYVDTRLHQ
tara:strand:- start:650 stop:1018 length:369 start_codon:yes stop_codon:yes gene_type:complete